MAKIIMLIVCVSFAGTACRSFQGLTGNQHAKPQVKFKWISRPAVDMAESETPTIYLRKFKDAVGADLDLTPQIKQAIKANGYRLTRNRKSADFHLIATLRHFDKANTFDGGSSAMKKVANAAPIAGAIMGYSSGDSCRSRALNGILGGTGGAFFGAMIDNYSQVNEWDMILDIELLEKVSPFIERRKGRSNNNSSSINRRDSERGSRGTSDERSSEYEKRKNHYRNTFRLVAVAYQTQMTRDEALGNLLPRLPGSIGSVLP